MEAQLVGILVMKRISHFLIFLFVFICCWLLTFAHSATAAQAVAASSPRHSGFYLGAQGGIAFPGNTNNAWWPIGGWQTGYAIGGQVGYWYKNFRFAGAIDYYNHQLTQASSWAVGLTTFMGNVYYDFKFGNFIIPYLGVGAGGLIASLAFNTQFLANNPSQSSFAYQGLAGVVLPINSSLGVDLSYHYLNWTSAPGNDNAVEVGLNFFF
jgi:opacity protein-like surface antigen